MRTSLIIIVTALITILTTLVLMRETTHPGPGFVIKDLESHHLDVRPWTSLEPLDEPERFHFAVVTDRTGGMREAVFEKGIGKVNLVQPAFVVSVGDVIEGYAPQGKRPSEDWDYASSMVRDFDAPFFHIAGNHEYKDTAMADTWRKHFGRSYYHFRYKGVLFLALNSELFEAPADWHSGPYPKEWRERQQEQMTYVEEVLADNQEVRWTFVFIHKPYWRARWERPENLKAHAGDPPPWERQTHVPEDWARIEAMLADRNYSIFAGHLHSYDYQDDSADKHSHDKIAMATMGGISRMRGVDYGEFDHFAWVTMTEDGPVIANLLLEGVLGKDVAMPKQRPYWID